MKKSIYYFKKETFLIVLLSLCSFGLMAQNSNSNFKFSPWMSIVLVLTIFFTISLFTDGLDLSNPGKTSLSKFNEYSLLLNHWKH